MRQNLELLIVIGCMLTAVVILVVVVLPDLGGMDPGGGPVP
jgi:hypothetical protein